MQESEPIHETVYSGPPLPPRVERVGEVSLADLTETTAALRAFFVRIFCWITGALLLSAFFASYSDRYEGDSSSFLSSLLMGQAVWLMIGGLMAVAYGVSRKVGDMPTSVAIAILIAYASLQGALFGWLYRAAYGASLVPVYLCIATVFGLLFACGKLTEIDLTSVRALVIGAVAAFVLAIVFKAVLNLQVIAACAACVCSWLLLSLVSYHSDFLSDLPSSFEDDPHGFKAASVGALQIYLDLMIVMILILQARWIRQSIVSLTDKGSGTTKMEL